MGCIINKKSDGVPLSELKDGEMAQIVSWPKDGYTDNDMIYKIIQRYDNCIVVLGECAGKGYASLLGVCGSNRPGPNYRVNILENGDTIKIEEIVTKV